MPLAAPTSKTARMLGSLIAPAARASFSKRRRPAGSPVLRGRGRPAFAPGRVRAPVASHVYRRLGTPDRVVGAKGGRGAGRSNAIDREAKRTARPAAPGRGQ